MVSLLAVWGFSGAAIAASMSRPINLTQRPLAATSMIPIASYSMAANPASQLPASVVSNLRSDLSKKTGIPAKKLRVVDAKQKSWPDGCLGLAKPDEMCTQAIVQGWQVILSNGTRRWVYRTDTQGKVYRLETPIQQPIKPRANRPPTNSEPVDVTALQPNPIPTHEQPPKLAANVLFRSISSGGFIGRTYQTTLHKDGRMVRVMMNPDGSSSQPEIRRISPIQALRFQHFATSRLARFDQLNYPATPGSADFFTVTLSTPSSTVRYADTIQSQLPKDLHTVVKAWDQLNQR
jgi:hypothetical protein